MGEGPIIAATGMAFEARIAAGRGVRVVCASAGARLRQKLEEAAAEGCRGILSFGVAGGLDAALRPGDWVVAAAVVIGGVRFPADRAWTNRLLLRLPGAVLAEIAGTEAPLGEAEAKRALRMRTAAAAVDMESHVAARFAAERQLPFAACRVILDPADASLPPAALEALNADGTLAMVRVTRSLISAPGQVPRLCRLGRDAARARVALARGRRLLGAGLGFPDLGLL